MGQVCSDFCADELAFDIYADADLEHSDSPSVRLHIYDVGGSKLVSRANKVFKRTGTGAFHAGVEIFGVEYSYGYTSKGTGIFGVPPGQCPRHLYREGDTVELGDTELSMMEVANILEGMARSDPWKGEEYNLLRHNCVHFCQAFCEELEVQSVPAWVRNLAAAGAMIADRYHGAQAKKNEIWDLAKSGKIAAEYKVKTKAKYHIQRAARSCEAARDCCGMARRAPPAVEDEMLPISAEGIGQPALSDEPRRAEPPQQEVPPPAPVRAPQGRIDWDTVLGSIQKAQTAAQQVQAHRQASPLGGELVPQQAAAAPAPRQAAPLGGVPARPPVDQGGFH